MCQLSIHTEFQLPFMFCTSDKYIPELNIQTMITKPIMNDNILKFYLLVSGEAVF